MRQGKVVFEEAGAPEVAEEVIGLDVKAGVVAPMIGIADADFECAEFR